MFLLFLQDHAILGADLVIVISLQLKPVLWHGSLYNIHLNDTFIDVSFS